jgi:hypothetical protein
MTLPQQNDILRQGVIALFSDEATQIFRVPSQVSFHPAAVRLGLGRTGPTKVLP